MAYEEIGYDIEYNGSHILVRLNVVLQWPPMSQMKIKIERTVMWPVGASNPISQRTIPIQVTEADSMMARITVTYLLEFVRRFPLKLFTEQSLHLSVAVSTSLTQDKRNHSHNPVDNPACHQRIGDEHGPAPGHCYIKSDRQQRVFVVFWTGIGGQVLAVRRPAENYVEARKLRPCRAQKLLTSIHSDRGRRKIESPLLLLKDDIEARCEGSI